MIRTHPNRSPYSAPSRTHCDSQYPRVFKGTDLTSLIHLMNPINIRSFPFPTKSEFIGIDHPRRSAIPVNAHTYKVAGYKQSESK